MILEHKNFTRYALGMYVSLVSLSLHLLPTYLFLYTFVQRRTHFRTISDDDFFPTIVNEMHLLMTSLR
jgi:hypothetical protein